MVEVVEVKGVGMVGVKGEGVLDRGGGVQVGRDGRVAGRGWLIKGVGVMGLKG